MQNTEQPVPTTVSLASRFDLGIVVDRDLFLKLDQIEGRPADAVLDQIEQSLPPFSRILARVNKQMWRRSLELAKTSLTHAKALFEDLSQRLDEATSKLRNIPRVNPLWMFFNGTVALIAVLCDIGLTCFVLPSILNIPARSALGIAVGCTPLVATLVIKELLERIQDTLAGYRSRPEGSWANRIATAVEHLFWAGFLAVNVVMLVKLAMGRLEAEKLLKALLDLTGTQRVPELDQAVVGSLLLWVGLVAVFDSALVIQKLMKQVHQRRDRREAEKQVISLRQELETVRKELLRAEAHAACEQAEWEEHQQRMAEIEEVVQQRDRVTLAEIRSREQAPEPEPVLAQVINRMLAPPAASGGTPQRVN